jgi:putative flippase GtrA
LLNLKVPHHLQNLNRFGLRENIVVAELVAERLAALALLEWDLVSGALVVSVVVFVVNVVVEFVVPVHCVALVAVPVPVDLSD